MLLLPRTSHGLQDVPQFHAIKTFMVQHGFHFLSDILNSRRNPQKIGFSAVGIPQEAQQSRSQALQEAGAERRRHNRSASLHPSDRESLVLDAVTSAYMPNPDP